MAQPHCGLRGLGNGSYTVLSRCISQISPPSEPAVAGPDCPGPDRSPCPWTGRAAGLQPGKRGQPGAGPPATRGISLPPPASVLLPCPARPRGLRGPPLALARLPGAGRPAGGRRWLRHGPLPAPYVRVRSDTDLGGNVSASQKHRGGGGTAGIPEQTACPATRSRARVAAQLGPPSPGSSHPRREGGLCPAPSCHPQMTLDLESSTAKKEYSSSASRKGSAVEDRTPS